MSKVAVLVDYENIHISLKENNQKRIPLNKLDVFSRVASQYGIVHKICIVARWNQSRDFQVVSEALDSFGLNSLNVTTSHKNASDLALTVECMKMSYLSGEDSVDVFVIFAGDGGYLPLVNHLRSKGKDVILYTVEGSSSTDLIRSLQSENKHQIFQQVLADELSDFDVTPVSVSLAVVTQKLASGIRRKGVVTRRQLHKWLVEDYNWSEPYTWEQINLAAQSDLIYERTQDVAGRLARVLEVNSEAEIVRQALEMQLP